MPHWLKGIVAVAVLMTCYVGVWRPVRAWSAQQVAAPVLAAAASSGWRVQAVVSPPSVHLACATETLSYNMPAGRSYLIPALLLAFLVPHIRVGMRLFGAALALGLIGFALALLTSRDVPGASAMLAFLDVYVTVPLLVGLALWWSRLLGGAKPGGPAGEPRMVA